MPSSTGSIVPGHLGDEGGLTKGRLAAFLAALAGSAVLGIVAGLIWAAVAPRPLVQEIAHGEAQYVNVETTAFIVADAWFALIAAVGGLITGPAGYRIPARRAGAAAPPGRGRCRPARLVGRREHRARDLQPPARDRPGRDLLPRLARAGRQEHPRV